MRWFVVAMLCVAGCLAGCLAGCVDQGPGPNARVDTSYIRAHLLASEPADIRRFDVTLGGKVAYLGNKLDRTRLAPGAPVTITHYWKVLAPIGPDWRVFTLVRGPAGTADFMNVDRSDMQVAHPPATWKAGEIIEDIQTFTMRPDWRSASATVLVGLIEVGRHGTLDRMAVTGSPSQDRAIVAATLEIDLSRAPPPPGTVHIPRANGAITIDGAATDVGWSNALTSPELVTAEGSPDPVGKATAKLTWNDEFLFLFVTVTDTDIISPYKQQDEPLWKADCIEIFIDADGNRRGYVELQVNPNNATFDSWFAAGRGPAGDEAWDSGMITAVQVRGSAAASDADTGWDVEIAIPWAAVKGKDDSMAIRTPPQIGDRWRLNVVRVDKRSGNETISATSWNRITYRDFHALDRMLVAIFADPSGAVVSPMPGDPAGAAGGAGGGSASSAGSAEGSAEGSAGSAGSAAPGAPQPGSTTMMRGTATVQPAAGSGHTTDPTAGHATGSTPGSAAPRIPDAGLRTPAGSAATAPRAGSAATAPRAGSAATAPRAGSAATAPRAGSAATTPRAGSAAPAQRAGSAATAPPAGSAAPP